MISGVSPLLVGEIGIGAVEQDSRPRSVALRDRDDQGGLARRRRDN